LEIAKISSPEVQKNKTHTKHSQKKNQNKKQKNPRARRRALESFGSTPFDNGK